MVTRRHISPDGHHNVRKNLKLLVKTHFQELLISREIFRRVRKIAKSAY